MQETRPSENGRRDHLFFIRKVVVAGCVPGGGVPVQCMEINTLVARHRQQQTQLCVGNCWSIQFCVVSSKKCCLQCKREVGGVCDSQAWGWTMGRFWHFIWACMHFISVGQRKRKRKEGQPLAAAGFSSGLRKWCVCV